MNWRSKEKLQGIAVVVFVVLAILVLLYLNLTGRIYFPGSDVNLVVPDYTQKCVEDCKEMTKLYDSQSQCIEECKQYWESK